MQEHTKLCLRVAVANQDDVEAGNDDINCDDSRYDYDCGSSDEWRRLLYH